MPGPASYHPSAAFGRPATRCLASQDQRHLTGAFRPQRHEPWPRNSIRQEPLARWDDISTRQVAQEPVGGRDGRGGARMRQHEDVKESLAAVIDMATHSGPCDSASITMLGEGRQKSTVAASDPLIQQADQLQYELHEGPCLDAVWVEGISPSRTWSPTAAGHIGRRGPPNSGSVSMLSLHLVHRRRARLAESVLTASPGVRPLRHRGGPGGRRARLRRARLRARPNRTCGRPSTHAT